MVKLAIKERRQFERVERVLSVEFRPVSKIHRDRSWRISMSSDLSRGGVSFYTDARLKEEEVIEVKIIMSGMIEVYSGRAKIIRVERRPSAAYALIAVNFLHDRHKKNRLCHGGVC